MKAHTYELRILILTKVRLIIAVLRTAFKAVVKFKVCGLLIQKDLPNKTKLSDPIRKELYFTEIFH